MSLEKVKKWTEDSWFFKWFLNSKTVVGLSVILLFLLVILVFSKVSYLFKPIGQFLGIVGFPLIFAGVLYYLLAPVMNLLVRKKVPKLVAIILIFVILLALVIGGIFVIIPKIQEQITSFAKNLPDYVKVLENKSQELLGDSVFKPLQSYFGNLQKNINGEFIDHVRSFGASAVPVIGGFFKTATTIVVGVITMPFFLFYLLKDGEKLLPSFLSLLPVKWQKNTESVLREVNDQLASYIRGQLIVAFSVAVMFIFGLRIAGLKYAVVLGISAGILNMIPYLGSFLAMIPIVLLAIVVGPWMLVKVLLVFAIEQTIEGRLISPLVLGSQLKMHPVTIIFVLLTSGSIAGVVGVIVGVPLFAIFKVIVVHIYQWYREVSDLYQEEGVKSEQK